MYQQLTDYLFEHTIVIFDWVKFHKFASSFNYWDILSMINKSRVWLIFSINLSVYLRLLKLRSLENKIYPISFANCLKLNNKNYTHVKPLLNNFKL